MASSNRFRHRVRKLFTCACAVSLFATGCSPAVWPMNQNDHGTGVPVSDATWNTLMSAVQAGEQVNMYKLKIDLHTSQGSLQTDFAVFGSINRPNRVSIEMLEAGNDTYFYEQGSVAYYRDNGQWSPANPLQNLDAFASYEPLMRLGAKQHVPLEQLKRVYVVDQYCDVYQATLPAMDPAPLQGLTAVPSAKDLGQVLYTFYIGQKDHTLRRVDLQTVSTAGVGGAMEMTGSLTFFDLNQKIAKIAIPADLAKQLEQRK